MTFIKSLFKHFCYTAAFFFTLYSLSFAGDVVNITVGQHQAELVKLPQDMTHVIINDRNVAGVVKHSERQVSVIGHKIGKTDIRIMNGKRIARQVNLTVTHDLPTIKRSLKTFFPDETIGLTLVNDSIALTGLVSNASVASKAVKIVQEFTAGGPSKTSVLNLMQLRTGQQVMLRVRVGEIQRAALKNLGLGVYGVLTSGASILGALEKEKILKVMAEPTLTAISGESAKFLAGGEFPCLLPRQTTPCLLSIKVSALALILPLLY